jgi:hypothetical protein
MDFERYWMLAGMCIMREWRLKDAVGCCWSEELALYD